MVRITKMFKNKGLQLWVGNYHNAFIVLILFLSCVSQIQCQIIRKSIELPVRDYLSPTRTGRSSRDGRDHLYVVGGDLDSVRTFEVLSPHTPASALMFAGLERNNIKVTSPSSTAFSEKSSTANNDRAVETESAKTFLPAELGSKYMNSLRKSKNLQSRNLISRSATPSTKLLKDGLNLAKKGYSFSFTAPSSDNQDIRGSHGSSQEFLPIYTTPFPALHDNNDASFGYFNKFPLPLPIAREGIVSYNTGRVDPTPAPTQFTIFNHEENIHPYSSPSPSYYPTSAYYPDKNSGGYQQSKDNLRYNPPSPYYRNQNIEENYDKSINSKENEQPSAGDTEKKRLPTIPPTIGVIGWKSNTDLNTNWKPNNELMDMANKHIKEDLKNDGYVKEPNTYSNNDDESSVNETEEQTSEEEEVNKHPEEGDEPEGVEEEDEKESEEEEEEREGQEENDGAEQEDNNDAQNEDNYRPETNFDPRSKYENYAENSHHTELNTGNKNENEPYFGAGYYYDGQTLPPGPPYDPPPSKLDERTKYGYLPPPSVTLGAVPYESYSGGVHQTWTPITPEAESQTIKGNKLTPKYKAENGRWLLNDGPILSSRFPEMDEPRFETWDEFGKEKFRNKLNLGESYSSKENRNNENPENYDTANNINTRFEDGFYGRKNTNNNYIPIEHRGDTNSKEDAAPEENENSDEPSSETESNYQPPTPPPDQDEQRERNRVSDHEYPRKVPTRLRYPGGGLWAKPAPDSGIELGFVPKKVYTQTRRHNTVKHLPREAALAAASTAEDIINAPRLREVVSHKKIQEVYEEEGYEDTGYDHGGYKKQGEREENRQKHDYGEDVTPSEWEGKDDEESFKEHVANLEAVPEDERDTSGQSSAKQQVVQTSSENPRVKGSWKQQKTTTNEQSMAFLDGDGKGGILTQRHPPKTEGVVGKVLEIGGKTVPVFQDISHTPNTPVSYQSSQNTHVGPEVPVVYPSGKYEDDIVDADKQYDTTRTVGDSLSTYVPGAHEITDDGLYSTINYDKPPEHNEQFPHLSSYVSRNNKFSYVPSKGEDNRSNSYYNGYNTDGKNPEPENEQRIYTTRGLGYDEGRLLDGVTSFNPVTATGASSNKQSQFADTTYRPLNIGAFETPNNSGQKQISKYQWNPVPGHIKGSYGSNDFKENDSSGKLPHNHKKERRSRDLTAFGIDRFTGLDDGVGDFVYPTAELTEIEEKISSLSSDVTERSARRRQVSNPDSSSSRKYQEIVRNPNPNSQEPTENTRSRVSNVRLAKDDLNIRHPFLPRDDNGDVKIDYIQPKSRHQPDTTPSRRRHHHREETTTTEPTTTTTTTQKATTVKSQPTTTTEYTPEDPSETLKRLRDNVFLASIFKGQIHEESVEDQPADSHTTTTPKVTTYRARSKTTTENVEVQGKSPDSIDRLKTNPFLTGIFVKDEKETITTEKPATRRRVTSRIKPIVVPEDVSAESSVKHVEQLTLAQYAGPSNGMLYKEVPIVVQQRMTHLAQHLNSQGVGSLHIIVRRSADGSITSDDSSKSNNENPPVDVEKYPFYFKPEMPTISKHSPLRYASNPKDIPIKTHGGMEFYESRDRAVRCEEPTPPKNIVPKREKEGEWNKNPQPDKQRLGKLGDQIDCLKLKYFGEDPLDNPFFKETVVGVPNLSTESPDDSFGFYSQIKSNIDSENVNDKEFFENTHSKRHINLESKYNETHSKTLPVGKTKHYSSKNDELNNNLKLKEYNPLDREVDENKLSTTTASLRNMRSSLKDVSNNSMRENSRNNQRQEDVNNLKDKTPNPKFSEINDMPVSLHPPQNVVISLKSKGTSNHPRIRYVSEVSAPHDMHIMIVPMGSVGYLKKHPSYHIKSQPSLKSAPLKKKLTHLLDPISTEASKITQTKKHPTTVTYLTVDSDGNLIHQHIRTFVPVRSERSEKKELTETPDRNLTTNWWTLIDNDERRGEPRYRVKRNNENDKYINSKESLELKKYLLQKYAEILAKEKAESKSNTPTGKVSTTEKSVSHNIISPTSRRSGDINKRRPPYSSRYRSEDPMHGSPSTDVETSRDVKSDVSSRTLPIRKPTLRFPKLAVPKPPNVNDASRTKLLNSPDSTSPRVATITTTTTTTEPPPSTTTRMYKPRVVYKKEYGKPIRRVVNMFAALKRHPTEASVTTTTSSTTEHVLEGTEPRERRSRPKRIQQFEHRTITKEEVFTKTYGPEDEIKERSDRGDTYESLFDHPDLRGPVSRISRETEEQHEVLVYMVSPTTGIGEWKYMQVPSSRISRMDQSTTSRERSNTKKSGKRKKSRAKVSSSEDYQDYEVSADVKREIDPTSAQASEDDVTTINPKKQRNKSRRKLHNSPYRNRMEPRPRGMITTPPEEEEEKEESTTSTEAEQPTTSVPTSTIHPKVIVEPHKRKYFYAKI